MNILVIVLIVCGLLGLGFWLGRSPWFSSKVEPEVDELLHQAANRLKGLRDTVHTAEAVIKDRLL